MGKIKKVVNKAKRAMKKGLNSVKNDPELRALVKNTASQLKGELVSGIRAGLTEASGGRITGSGDYKVSKNVNRGNSISSRSLNVASSIVIEREEFVGQVVSSATAKGFTIQKFRVNPGNYAAFPWGSSVALGYESWEPLSMQFMLKSTSGDSLNSTDTSLGKVCLAAQYNTYARDWDSFPELENANDSVVGKPSDNLLLGIECKKTLRGAKTLYVSQQDPLTSGKPFYDLCDVYVASIGLQGMNVRVSDLFVRYRVKLFNPIVRDSETPDMSFGVQGTIPDTTHALSLTGTIVENLSTKVGGSLTITSTSVLTGVVRPLNGRVRLCIQWGVVGSSTTRTPPTVVVTASSLDVPLTVTDDVSLTASAVYFHPATSAGVGCVSVRNVVLPVNTDTFVITFGTPTLAASDVYQVTATLTPYESSDF